ncbi:hypothetical protein ACJX0J_008196, partial [Zea mays]
QHATNAPDLRLVCYTTWHIWKEQEVHMLSFPFFGLYLKPLISYLHLNEMCHIGCIENYSSNTLGHNFFINRFQPFQAIFILISVIVSTLVDMFFYIIKSNIKTYFLLVAVAIIPYSCAVIAFSIKDATSGEAAWVFVNFEEGIFVAHIQHVTNAPDLRLQMARGVHIFPFRAIAWVLISLSIAFNLSKQFSFQFSIWQELHILVL